MSDNTNETVDAPIPARHGFKPGDRIKWRYQGDILKGKILEFSADSNRAHIKFDGWASTEWISSYSLVGELDPRRL